MALPASPLSNRGITQRNLRQCPVILTTTTTTTSSTRRREEEGGAVMGEAPNAQASVVGRTNNDAQAAASNRKQ